MGRADRRARTQPIIGEAVLHAGRDRFVPHPSFFLAYTVISVSKAICEVHLGCGSAGKMADRPGCPSCLEPICRFEYPTPIQRIANRESRRRFRSHQTPTVEFFLEDICGLSDMRNRIRIRSSINADWKTLTYDSNSHCTKPRRKSHRCWSVAILDQLAILDQSQSCDLLEFTAAALKALCLTVGVS